MGDEISVDRGIVSIRGKESGTKVLAFQGDNGNARTVEIPAGETFRRDLTSCERIRLINSAIANDFTISADIATRNEIAAMERDCPTERVAWPAGKGEVDPNQDINSSQSPEASKSSPAVQTGAPNPEPEVLLSSVQPGPGKSDGRSLSEQFLDQQQPKPDYEIADILLDEGVPPAALDKELRRIRRNEAPKGQHHPTLSLDDSPDLLGAADPILLFSGQFTVTVVDLEIPSRGFPLHFARTYRSGQPFFGPLGFNWDHSYNAYLRQLVNGDLALWLGEGHEQLYRMEGTGFQPPLGEFRLLQKLPSSTTEPERFVLTDREGFERVFFAPPSWPLSERIPLMTLRDRHNNSHHLTYDSEGQLELVEDHAGRYIQFEYGDCGLLEQTSDHTGRKWVYLHDPEIEHLVGALSPGTPDQSAGYLTRYVYDSFQSHPALQHNITTMIDPAGNAIVENQYGDDPASDNFGRVCVQRWAGFEATFCVRHLQYVPRRPEAINVPAVQVETNESGVVKVFTFNYRGNLLDERMRLTRDESFRLIAHISTYDSQGNRIVNRLPSGMRVLYSFDHEHPDPRARGNILKVELVAPPGRPTTSRIVQTTAYEPKYNRVKSVRNELGSTVTLHYDFELGTGAVGDVSYVEFPAATLADGTRQNKREYYHHNAHGQIVEMITGQGHRHLFEYGTSLQTQGYLLAITRDVNGAAEREVYEYDAQGNVSAVTDGKGSRTDLFTDALRRRLRVQRPAVNGKRAEVRFFYNSIGKVEREEWPRGDFNIGTSTDAFIAHTYKYYCAGNVKQMTLGSNTPLPRHHEYHYDYSGALVSSRDALERRSSIVRDERGLPILITTAAGTADSKTVRMAYDFNGNLVRHVSAEGDVTRFIYDSWDRLESVFCPKENSAEQTVCRYVYGALDLVKGIEITGAVRQGVIGELLKVEYEYDERARLRTRLKGDRMVRTMFDADDRITVSRDQRGAEFSCKWDGLDRIKSITDPLGNQTLYQYDAAGNVTKIEDAEILPDDSMARMWIELDYDSCGRIKTLSDSFGRLSTLRYDERDLLTSWTDFLGRTCRQEWGLLKELQALELPTGSEVAPFRHEISYDKGGRIQEYRDPEGIKTRYQFDYQDRCTEVKLADGRYRRFEYAGRHVVEHMPGGSKLESVYGDDGMLANQVCAAGSAVSPVLPTSFYWDGLSRLIRLQDGSMDIDRTFDSFGRLISETVDGGTVTITYDDLLGQVRLRYPDGRTDRLQYDLLGRLTSIVLEKLGTLKLTGHLTAGTVLATYEYLGASAAVYRRVLHNNLETLYEFDAARRLSAAIHRTGSGATVANMAWLYDAGDRRRIAWASPAPQRTHRFTYDDLSRLRKAEIDINLSRPTPAPDSITANTALNTISGASIFTEIYTVNRSDVRTACSRTDGIKETYTLDAAYRIQNLTQTPGVATTFEFDAEGNCVRDLKRRYRFDARGRLVEIRNIANTMSLVQIHYDALGRVTKKIEAGGKVTIYRWLGHHRVQMHRPSTLETFQFTYGARLDEIPIESHGTNRYPIQDPAGTLLAYVSEDDRVVERYSYTPFGEVSIFSPDGSTARTVSAVDGLPRFAGHMVFADGLYEARARVYDPRLGRFLQPDRSGYGGGANLYVYAQHNPVDFIDPDGENPLLIAVLIAAGVGALLGGFGTAAAKPDASWEDIIEGSTVGAAAGAASALTFGYAAPALAAAGYGVVTTGIIAGGAAGASGGLVSGGWYGGRQGYAKSQGNLACTLQEAAYGGVKGATIGAISGAATAGVTGHVWSRVVTNGALASGEAAALRNGIQVPSRFISPASFAGNALQGVSGGITGGVTQSLAETGWNYLTDEPIPTGADWSRNILLGAGGGITGAIVQRYTPGTGMYRYANKYQTARTQEGAIWATGGASEFGEYNRSPRFRATRAFRAARGLPRKGFVHHERAVAGYPELFDDFDIMTWLPDEAAHIEAHMNNSTEVALNPLSSITHGPSTPRFPGIPSFSPLGFHFK